MNKNLKFAVWVLILTLQFLLPRLHAQDQTVSGNLTVGNAFTAGANSSTAQLQFRLNGTILSTGVDVYNTGGQLLSSDASITGSFFLWYPAKSALWAGYMDSGKPHLTDAYIGESSVSLGQNNVASGIDAIAMGQDNVSSGIATVALGQGNTSSNSAAVAVGYNNTSSGVNAVALGGQATAPGYRALAVGQSYAAGMYSIALNGGTAVGNFSTAMGSAYVTGSYSTAMGTGQVTGDYSFALGNNAQVNGAPGACAIGTQINVSSYNATAVGAYNVGGGNPFSWVPTEPLFEVGNGGGIVGTTQYGNPAINGRSDALVVYKNGNVAAAGVMTAQPGGDIPMFSGY